MMSLDPHWASTIMGVLRFSGLVTAGLAAIAIVAVTRSRTDASITSDHIHDVAKLLFAFSTFWMYIWFSQAMLIWYTNMPEEASWYSVRGFGNWSVLMWATVALMWVVPFLVLLSEKAKRNRTVLLRVSVVVLIGHWLDLYVTIVPAHSPEPRVTGWDLAIALGAFAAVGWAVTRRDDAEARLSFSRLRCDSRQACSYRDPSPPRTGARRRARGSEVRTRATRKALEVATGPDDRLTLDKLIVRATLRSDSVCFGSRLGSGTVAS